MKQIDTINISELNLSAASSVRAFSATGEDGSEFLLQVFNSSQQFYNFKTKAFGSVTNSETSIKAKINGSSYNTSIVFPASSAGLTYTVLVIPKENTEFSYTSKRSETFSIFQIANSTLTFSFGVADDSAYGDLPSNITQVASPNSNVSVRKDVNVKIPSLGGDAHRFGIRLTRQPVDTDWFFQTGEAILSNPLGDAVSNNQVIVSDLTDIATGMELIFHKGTTAPAATTLITAIDLSTKTITFSTSTAFEDGETMTLRAKGSSVIKKAIGADIDFSNFNANVVSAKADLVTRSVRTTATNETIPLVGTTGVSGGGFVTISGVDIKNTSANTVQTVVAGSADGSVVMQVAQDIKAGSVITFTGSTTNITIKNSFTINSYPSANKTISLNLDNFITPGVSGA